MYGMINLITESVSISLYAEFGDEYMIYREEIKQDLQEPCFFISCINPVERLVRKTKYFRENLFCIQYFPRDANRKNEECYEVAERIFASLRWLDVAGDSVMGTNMRYEITEGILHFFVNYNMFVDRAVVPATRMEEIAEAVSVKGEVM